jgi:hypothetical protein
MPAAPACVASRRDSIMATLLFAMHPHFGLLQHSCSLASADKNVRPIFFAWWRYFGRAHSKNRHQKTGACSQSASQPPACRPYLRPTKIAGPLPESLALQIAAVIAWSYSRPDTSHRATKVKWSRFETCLLLPCNSGSGRQPKGTSMVALTQVMVTSEMR